MNGNGKTTNNRPVPTKAGYVEEDVVKGRVDHLIEHRVPWLLIGLFGGIVATLIVARYEALLEADVRLAFFIPIIVYLSDAVGTQTETIYVRAMAKGRKVRFPVYIMKESLVGSGLGVISGTVLGLLARFYFGSARIGLTIGLTMLVNLTLAPVLAVLIPTALSWRKTDPALGAGPLATVIQDLLSLLIYFFIASVML